MSLIIVQFVNNCYNFFMKILGIDPGMAIVGYGMIGVVNDKIELLNNLGMVWAFA